METHTTRRRARWNFLPFPGILAIAALLVGLAPTGAAAQTSERCFTETGSCISGRIREFWEQNGGLPVFGLPLAPQQEQARAAPEKPGDRGVAHVQPPGIGAEGGQHQPPSHAHLSLRGPDYPAVGPLNLSS